MIVEDLPELKGVVPPKKAAKLLMDFDKHPVFIFRESKRDLVTGLLGDLECISGLSRLQSRPAKFPLTPPKTCQLRADNRREVTSVDTMSGISHIRVP